MASESRMLILEVLPLTHLNKTIAETELPLWTLEAEEFTEAPPSYDPANSGPTEGCLSIFLSALKYPISN